MGQFVQQPEIDWGAPGVPSGWGWVDGISGGIQPAQPPGMSWIFFFPNLFSGSCETRTGVSKE